MADEPKPSTGPRALGPFEPKVYVPPPKEGAAAARTEPVLTEGMKARRRQTEKRRREESVKKSEAEEESAAGWERARSILLRLLVVFALVFAYWRLQVQYPDNRWPLELVWAFMVVGLAGTLGWTLWYLNKGD
jgi:hypothetical protein